MIIDENCNKYLNKNELIEMANIMSDAFLTHSNFVYTIKRDDKRKKVLFNTFLMMYKIINKYGYISVVKKDLKSIGYITFMDAKDKAQISFMRILRTNSLLLVIKLIFNLRIAEIAKLIKYLKIYNKYQKEENKEGKVHLYSTGVDFNYKGKGYMGKAIRNSYMYFQDLGYNEMTLETADLSNIPIYEKLGFTVIKRISTSDEKQTICFMVKKLYQKV
jgi:ribosomal protein S18 acetylase RimI-like enzyme